MVDQDDPRQLELEGTIRQSLGQALFPISIPLDAAVGEGLMMDKPAVIHTPDSPSATAYRKLTEHLLSAKPAQSG